MIHDTLPHITEKNSSPRGYRMVLYSTGKDPSKEKWDGASTRFPDVISLFGADDACPLEIFTDDLRAFVARAQHVYVDLPVPSRHHHHHRHHHRRRIVGAAGTSRFPFFKYLSSRRQSLLSSFEGGSDGEHAEMGSSSYSYSYLDVIASATSISKRKALAPLVGALRSVKSEYEVEVMKASAEISSRAHAKVSQSFFGFDFMHAILQCNGMNV